MAIPTEYKTCSKCKASRPLADFSCRTGYSDRYRAQCRSCRSLYTRAYLADNPDAQERIRGYPRKAESSVALRNRMRVQRYGISADRYDRLLKDQRGICAICGCGPEKSANGVLGVDHCHETGRIRGLLCSRCNSAIGQLGDTVVGLMRAVCYLRRNQEKHNRDPIDFAQLHGLLL